MKHWQLPTTSIVLDAKRVEMAREVSRAIRLKLGLSAGIRYSLSQVKRDPRAALDWVIRRYGDPLPPPETDKPVYWLPAMYNVWGAPSGPATISGLDATLKSVAHAFGYGTSSRGISFAIDYTHQREAMPVPEYIAGEKNASPRYVHCTLDQHVAYYEKQLQLNMMRLAKATSVRAEINHELRRAKLGLGPAALTPEELAREPAVPAEPDEQPDNWLAVPPV